MLSKSSNGENKAESHDGGMGDIRSEERVFVFTVI